MASVGDQIIEALVAAIAAPAVPLGASVGRFQVQQPVPPFIGVYGLVEEVTPIAGRGALVHRGMMVMVEVRVQDDPPDRAVDPLLVHATKRIMAGDRRLGGLCNGIKELKTEWKAQPGARIMGAGTRFFLVAYQTRADDPEAQA